MTDDVSKLGIHQCDIRQSESQGRWNLLLRLASATTVAVCHTSLYFRQEAQLPLRNGVSNAFLCSYVTFYRRNDLHLRLSPPKPASEDPANLLRIGLGVAAVKST